MDSRIKHDENCALYIDTDVDDLLSWILPSDICNCSKHDEQVKRDERVSTGEE